MGASKKTFEDLDKLCDDASAAFEDDQFEKARTLYLEALSTCDGLMDEEYRISIRQYLAVSWYRLEDFKEAARHDRKTLELLVGGSSQKLVTIRHNLARDLSAVHDQTPSNSLDRLDEAIKLHRENLETLQKSNKRAEELLETQYSLSFDLAKLSKSSTDSGLAGRLLEEAANLDIKVLTAREKVDPKAPLTLQSRHNLASVLYHLKKYSQAKELFLRNQQFLDSMSSKEKKKHTVLRQSTDRHLAACCEATKDVNLSISRIAAEYERRHKSSKASNTKTKSPSPITDEAVKLSANSKAEPGGKLWNLSVENININGKPKTTPTGLDPPLKLPRINEPSSGGTFSGIATGGSSRVHMGNVYANNVNYYYNSPAPGTKSYDHGPLLQPHTTFSLEPPKSKSSGMKRSSSQGRSSLQPDPVIRPRSASGARPEDTVPGGRMQRSQSVSALHSRVVEKVSKQKSGSSDPAVGLKTASFSSSKTGEAPCSRRGSSSESQTSQHTPHRSFENLRSPSSASKPISTMTKADQWFAELQEHAHALLNYDNKSLIPIRRRVRVAIIDSGIDLPAKVSERRADVQRHRDSLHRYKNFTPETSSWSDSSPSFHGTNCASILLQVAPHAELYIANVVRKSTGTPSPSSVSAALEWALEKKVDIVSMSLGFDQMHEDISKQINLARLKGVLIFAAASNDGPNAPDWGAFPAWLSNVFCINSADSSGAKSWFNPRNTDEKLNFMFIGEEIGILSEDGTLVADLPRLTGTSFATPIAAGTAALVLDLVRMQKIETASPKVEPCLKTYEGMSAVFKMMSSPPTAFGAEFYNVRPWRLLGKKGPPLSRPNEPNESKQWYTLLKVVECLARFGDLDTGIEALD